MNYQISATPSQNRCVPKTRDLKTVGINSRITRNSIPPNRYKERRMNQTRLALANMYTPVTNALPEEHQVKVPKLVDALTKRQNPINAADVILFRFAFVAMRQFGS